VSLMSIGEFARLSRLSPKALRLYAELGLLMTDQVATGDIPARRLLRLQQHVTPTSL
jgi:hypothetical protein